MGRVLTNQFKYFWNSHLKSIILIENAANNGNSKQICKPDSTKHVKPLPYVCLSTCLPWRCHRHFSSVITPQPDIFRMKCVVTSHHGTFSNVNCITLSSVEAPDNFQSVLECRVMLSVAVNLNAFDKKWCDKVFGSNIHVYSMNALDINKIFISPFESRLNVPWSFVGWWRHSFRQSNRNTYPIHFIYRQTFRLLIDKYNKLFKKGLCDSQGNWKF